MSEMPPVAPPLLECAPEEGARRLALRWIDEAVGAADKLVEGSDDEALHDMRVALRKLRTVFRTYREELRGSLEKKKKKERLKELVSATGPARDAEVQIAWLESVRGELDGGAQRGVDWLEERLRDRRDGGYVRLRSATVPALLELLPRLRRDLERYAIEHVVGEPRPAQRFADATAELLRAQAYELRDDLRGVRSIEDEELAHEARKAGKRLRYLLEPLRDEEVAGAKELVKSLKKLQDLLGALNDVAVRARLLREEIESAALERARRLASQAEGDADAGIAGSSEGDEQPGLLALVRVTHALRQELFGALMAHWIAANGELDALVSEVESFAGSLASGGPRDAADAADDAGAAPAASEQPPREIEHKYLLSSLPPRAREHESIEIDQGYVPGEKLNERLRRTRSDGVERWYRTVKLGRGAVRIEIEEETSREIFAKMWSLTKGQRVRKRRYRVPEGELVWEIDEFLDRELFLAEIELPSEDSEYSIPDWLAPHLVREVTDEPAYLNLNLAR